MTTILSIDPGSKFFGWAIISFDNTKCRVIDHGMIKPSKIETISGSGYKMINDLVYMLYNKYKPDKCIVENFGLVRRLKGAFIIPKVHSIIELTWYLLTNEDPIFIQPNAWKYYLTNNSRATKEETIEYIDKNNLAPGHSTMRHDEYDAIGIGIGYYRSLINKIKFIKPIIKKRKKIISKKKK